MKHLITPTTKEIQERMDRYGEVILKLEDRDDGYYRAVFVDPAEVSEPKVSEKREDHVLWGDFIERVLQDCVSHEDCESCKEQWPMFLAGAEAALARCEAAEARATHIAPPGTILAKVEAMEAKLDKLLKIADLAGDRHEFLAGRLTELENKLDRILQVAEAGGSVEATVDGKRVVFTWGPPPTE